MCKGVSSISSAAHLSQHLHRQLRADLLCLHQDVQRLDQAVAEPGRPESLSNMSTEQCVAKTAASALPRFQAHLVCRYSCVAAISACAHVRAPDPPLYFSRYSVP